MANSAKGQRLCVYISEADRFRHQPLVDALIEAARDEGIAGGTAMRGIEGFGASRHLATARMLSSSDNLPVVVVFVDDEINIGRFVPTVENMIGHGLVTVEDVDFPCRRGHGIDRHSETR